VIAVTDDVANKVAESTPIQTKIAIVMTGRLVIIKDINVGTNPVINPIGAIINPATAVPKKPITPATMPTIQRAR
jgi:hypothetical protein